MNERFWFCDDAKGISLFRGILRSSFEADDSGVDRDGNLHTWPAVNPENALIFDENIRYGHL